MRFFLGVGGQKAGTSWLHAYLQRYPEFDFGLLKEYHVWDAVYVEECGEITAARPERFFRRDEDGRAVPSKSEFLRYQMQQRDGAYEEYFRRLIESGADATGDITPMYAGLEARDLAEVRLRLEEVFAAGEIYFGVYEEMLTSPRLEELSRFCGVEPDVSFVSTRVNFSPKEQRVSAELKADVMAFYAEVYEFCGDRFPQTRQLWHQH